jgi:ornithine cyclodeaminase/alanine dehydrogenase-like protein (mu-crystallin family)
MFIVSSNRTRILAIARNGATRTKSTIITSFNGSFGPVPSNPENDGLGLDKSVPHSPRIIPYSVITTLIQPSHAMNNVVERSFAMLAKGKVVIPTQMHIPIAEEGWIGPGDSMIKAAYIKGNSTITTKISNDNFVSNVALGLSTSSSTFIVNDAVTGYPLSIMCDNRYLSDLRTGATAAVAVRHLKPFASILSVAFVGTGHVARHVALATSFEHEFDYAYCYDPSEARCAQFCKDMNRALKTEFIMCESAKRALIDADIVFTQTP